MLSTDSILKLYANVVHDDIVLNAIPKSEIQAGFQCMNNAYLKKADYKTTVIELPNYNNIAFRCAYLHEYAPLHTYIVQKVMLQIFDKEPDLFRELLAKTKRFRICSLGAGPGSDVVGVLAALNTVFNAFNFHATLIDCMEGWKKTFIWVLAEHKFARYGAKWQKIAKQLKWNYIAANLMCSMTGKVNTAIASASFITMVKFLSATACTNTEEMVDKIFRVMKPGALVLFIDSAEGGFAEIVERAARKNGLVSKFDLRHEAYEVEDLKVCSFGHLSCFKTRVTIILLQKALNYQEIMNNFDPVQNALSYDVAIAKPISSLDFVVLDSNDSCRGKMLNVDNNRPPQLIKQTSPDLKTQKPPIPSAVVEHNKVAFSKSKNSAPGLSTSVIIDLLAKVDSLEPGFKKPNASAGQINLKGQPAREMDDSSEGRSGRCVIS